MKIVIIIPTYNERENTVKMIPILAGVVAGIKKHKVEVLYVDDSSPDKTTEVIKYAKAKYSWLHLLEGSPKLGLGAAYARGMQYAMKELKADFLMEFDADFQHPPQVIPKLIAEIDNGYDYIIASRYVSGGSIPANWTIDRKAVSLVGNLIARIGLLTPQIHDCTGGFKLSRVKGFMDQFDFDTLYSKKFAYKIHLLAYMVISKKAKTKEISFHFSDRDSGTSKYLTNEIYESLKTIFLFQYHNPKIIRFFRFAVVGFVGYAVNASTLLLFTLLKWSSVMAWGVSTELAIISNFTWNNLWTFRDQKISGWSKLLSKFAQFNLTSMGGLLIQVVVGVISDNLIGPQYRQLVLPLAIAFLVLPYNFLMYNLVIWKKSPTPVQTPKKTRLRSL
jgi:dolichol-phosphate mannosyltransferase